MLDGAEKRNEHEWERTAWHAARTVEIWGKKRIDHLKLLDRQRPQTPKTKRAPTAKEIAAFDSVLLDGPPPGKEQTAEERQAALAKLQRQVDDLAARGLLPE